MSKIKSPFIERALIALLLVLLIFNWENSREKKQVYLHKVIVKDSLLDIQSKKIRELEDEKETLLSTIDLRESELEYWYHVSNLLKENKLDEMKDFEVGDFFESVND